MSGKPSVRIVRDQLELGPVTIDFQRDLANPGDGIASAAAGSGPVVAAGADYSTPHQRSGWRVAG